MNETFRKQFGLMVAYLLPGFIGLFGMAPFVPAVAKWLQPANQGDLGIGPTIYGILAAVAVGMIISCFRWVLIDHVHHWSGIGPPAWDASHLEKRLDAFDYLVEMHYRYYQFYANTILAVLLAYGLNRFEKTSPLLGIGTDFGVAILCIVLFVGSRDALANYYAATSRLVGHVAEKDHSGAHMTNGCGHEKVPCATSPRTAPESNTNAKWASSDAQAHIPRTGATAVPHVATDSRGTSASDAETK